MFETPMKEGFENGEEALTFGGETVIDVGGHAALLSTKDDIFSLESAQGLGEHALGDIGYSPAQFSITVRAEGEVSQD